MEDRLVSTKCRAHVGRVGALAIALGIGTAAATGFSAPQAHADADGSSSSSSRSANDRASRSTIESNNQGSGRSAKATAPRAAFPPVPGVSASHRADNPTAGLVVTPPSHPAIDMTQSSENSPTAPATQAATVEVSAATRLDDAPADRLVAASSGSTSSVTPVVVSAQVLSRVIPLPAAAVKAVPSPIASVTPAASVGNFLASLSSALNGGSPTVPADGALALMVGAVRREIGSALNPQAAATKIAAATSTSSTTTSAAEAEKMVVSPATSARMVYDRNASGRYVLALSSSGTASTTVNVAASTALTIRAKASSGSPNMTLSIDGKPITTVVVSSKSYQDYTFAGTIPAGTHVISVSSSNATSLRTLYLDKVSTTMGAVGDHFTGNSGSAPSSTIWTPTIGTGWDPGIQNYTSSGAYLDGQSHLVIQATRGQTGAWTSGRVETANKLSFGYGTVTARIMVPKGQGLWPAFWLIGADAATNGWPQTGEIDVMELPSTTTTMYSTLHGPIAGTTATQQAQIISHLPDLSTGYHNYWVTHLENQITFGVDGQTLGTLTPADLAPGETWVYNRPMSAILNLAVGGGWAGAPDSTTPATAKMLVESMTFVPA